MYRFNEQLRHEGGERARSKANREAGSTRPQNELVGKKRGYVGKKKPEL